MKKVIKTVLIFLILSICLSSISLATEDNSNYIIDIKDTKSLKRQVDQLNKKINEIHSDAVLTKNNVKIYTSEEITKLDTYNNQIILLEETMIQGKQLAIKYPLVSEIEQLGLDMGYTARVHTDKYFGEKVEYDNKLVDYEYFREVSLQQFIEAVELVSTLGINIEGMSIVFNPYRILSGYAYYQDYVPEGIEMRRSRIYFNPNEGEDIISTLYHEIGHMIYSENVENKEKNYERYYDIYRKEFDSNNASNRYETPWDKKLTENFAEDFKVYVSNKISSIEYGWIHKFMDERKESFFNKDTVYKLPTYRTEKYLDNLLIEQKELPNILRGDISIKLSDYKEEFHIYENSYEETYPNKIHTKSNTVNISTNNSDLAQLKLKGAEMYRDGKTIKINDITSIKLTEGINEIYLKFGQADYEKEIMIVIHKH